MNEKKEIEQKNNKLDFDLKEYLDEKLENRILHFHSKKKLNNDISSDSSSELSHINYYENFLKSLKNEKNEKNEKQKKISKKNKNSLKLKNKTNNTKEYKNNIVINRYNSNKNSNPYQEIDNNLHNFFKIRPRSMSKYFMKNQLYIEDMPKKKIGESYLNFGKGHHHKFILEHSKNKINEVDESIFSNQNNNNDIYSNINNNNIILYSSHPKKSIILKHNISNGNFLNKNNEIKESNILDKKKIGKLNDKKENKKNNSITPFTKDTEENLNTKNETNTLNNNENNNFQYSIPTKKKKRLLCCCIPIG